MNWWEQRCAAKKKTVEEPRISWDLFKFQRPLILMTSHPTILVYNSFKTIHFTMPYDDPEGWEELFRGQPKVYAWGRLSKDGHFSFDTTREIIRDPKEFPEW